MAWCRVRACVDTRPQEAYCAEATIYFVLDLGAKGAYSLALLRSNYYSIDQLDEVKRLGSEVSGAMRNVEAKRATLKLFISLPWPCRKYSARPWPPPGRSSWPAVSFLRPNPRLEPLSNCTILYGSSWLLPKWLTIDERHPTDTGPSFRT